MPDVGDLVQARVSATFCGQQVMNSMSFAAVAPFGTWSELANQMISDLDTAVGILGSAGIWTTGLNVGYAIQTIEVIDIFPGIAPLHSVNSGAVGSVDDDDALPPNDSLCVTLRSDFKGASGRGRIYFTGFSEGTQNAGFWLGPTQEYARAIGNALLDNFGEEAGSANFRWAVLHRYAGGAPVVPPEVKPIMNITVHNEVRSIGRRAIGRRISRRTVTP